MVLQSFFKLIPTCADFYLYTRMLEISSTEFCPDILILQLKGKLFRQLYIIYL